VASFRFEPYDLPPEAEALRGEVRAFLKDWMGNKRSARAAGSE